jgi:hypothetical protein
MLPDITSHVFTPEWKPHPHLAIPYMFHYFVVMIDDGQLL